MRTTLVTLFAMAAPIAAIHAQVFTFGGINLAIPDSDSSGVFDERTISTATSSIGHLAVNLTLSGLGSGAYNGDLYVSLSHTLPDNTTTLFSVLLNRPGRRDAPDDIGYSDNGISVTLDDVAGIGNIHRYRLMLNGDHDTPLAGPLTGTWQSDAREIDPASSGAAFEAAVRTAGLDRFTGVDPNGTWRLFVADVGEFAGGTARLDGWQLQVTPMAPVPEPGEIALVSALGLGALAMWRRRGLVR